jgi:hypothetical protein
MVSEIIPSPEENSRFIYAIQTKTRRGQDPPVFACVAGTGAPGQLNPAIEPQGRAHMNKYRVHKPANSRPAPWQSWPNLENSPQYAEN